jgi:DHA1 family bicyclomycin/chloramphenicol resistance-like MFS transporter
VRYGSARVANFSAWVSLGASALLLVVALAAGGVPSFWIWFGLLAVANAFITLLTPTCYSLGLAPMGERAGTASAVMGFASAAGGAILAGIVSARIDDTVTPMAVGYVVYGAAAVGLLWWARRAAPADRRSLAGAATTAS